MKNIKFVIVMALTVFAVSNMVSSTRVGRQLVENVAGQFENITDLNDPHVQAVARFAVSTYDQQKGLALLFSRVLYGSQKQVVVAGPVTLGTSWHLFVEVFISQQGGPIDAYEAVIFEAQDGTDNLMSFVEIK